MAIAEQSGATPSNPQPNATSDSAQPTTPQVAQPPNKLKDVWIPLICAVLGFVFGVATDIIKQEYQYRISLARIQFSPKNEPQFQTPGGFSRVFATKIQRTGRLPIPAIKILAERKDPTIRISDDFPESEPTISPNIPLQIEHQGHEDEVREISIKNLQPSQSVIWRIKVESKVNIEDDAISFSCPSCPDSLLKNANSHRSMSFQILSLIFLIGYSVVMTVVAFRLQKKLSDAIARKPEKGRSAG